MPPGEQPFSRVGRDAAADTRRPASIDGFAAPVRGRPYVPINRQPAPVTSAPIEQAPQAADQFVVPVTIAPSAPQPVAAAPQPPMPPPPESPPQARVFTPPIAAQAPTAQEVPQAQPAPTQPPQAETAAPAALPSQPRASLKIAKRAVIAGSTGFGIVAIIGAMAWGWMWYGNRANPDKVFAAALEQSFATTSLEQTLTTTGGTSQANFDFSNAKNTVVDTVSTLKMGGADFQLSGYGSKDNSYVSFTKTPASLKDASAQSIQNRWVQLRAGGNLAPTADKNLAALADPRTQTVGPLVFGNFDLKTRQQFVSYITNNNIYKYDKTKVKKDKFNGQTALVYPVTVNVGYLKVFNQSVATVAGYSVEDVQKATDNLDSLKEASFTVYVDPATKHFVGLVTQSGDNLRTYTYGKYNSAQMSAEPQTHLTWTQFAPLTYQIQAEIAGQQSPAIRDAARQQNLAAIHDALKAYFDANGTYPTLANLNNVDWLQKNMPAVDTGFFRDPVGTTVQFTTAPKAGQYAYQVMPASNKGGCNNLDQPCVHYKLSAIQSDNKPYVVQDP